MNCSRCERPANLCECLRSYWIEAVDRRHKDYAEGYRFRVIFVPLDGEGPNRIVGQFETFASAENYRDSCEARFREN